MDGSDVDVVLIALFPFPMGMIPVPAVCCTDDDDDDDDADVAATTTALVISVVVLDGSEDGRTVTGGGK